MNSSPGIERRARAILPLFLAAVALSCRTSTGAKSTSIPVRIAFTNVPVSYLPIIMAEQLGYYRAEGLSVTIDDLPSAAKSLEALLAGSADVAAGNLEQDIQMAVEQRHIKAFILMMGQSSRVLIVAPARADKIRRVENLRGATIGVAGLGSVNNMFLDYLLLKHGVKPKEVTTIAIGTGATALAAIEHQRVDAAVLVGSEPEIAKKRFPGMAILVDSRGAAGARAVYGADAYPSSVLHSTEAWLVKNPEVARRIARSIQRALNWTHTHSPEQILAQMPEHYRLGDREAELESLRIVVSGLSPDGVIPPGGVETVRKVLSFSMEKVRQSNFDLSQIYTNEFVRAQ
jgi:NitT/TauT family transport system substrate-binding protein